MIGIIDYGMGNIGSIKNMLKKIGAASFIVKDSSMLKDAQKYILPGVGAFDEGMKNLEKLGYIDSMRKIVLAKKVPILGICLGMQLLTMKSEEGQLAGLGFLNASTVRFNHNDISNKLKIPHMGWNTIDIIKDSAIFKDMPENYRFYFVHSYYVVCNNSEDIISRTNYGTHFVSAFQRDNIMGVQFHPEKSHKFGMKILENFAGL